MATTREKIERFEIELGNALAPWKRFSYSRKWLKKQMNRYIRREGKRIDDDEQ